jgi:UDP-glucuronate 4-epimerase
MTILLTGCAGFIGFHTAKKLLSKKIKVIGIDNLNNYYDIRLKKNRLKLLLKFKNFKFKKINLTNKSKLESIFKKSKVKYVINLAAQAGVGYSLINPNAYIESNITGFLNILECCKSYKIKHLIYASSSSVYGANKKIPFAEKQEVNHPISLYAATKRSNELMAHTYSHLFNLPTTGLRFFTVYGPMGRPDMAIYIFVKNILENKIIDINNNGEMKRDFTYIDDIVNGIEKIIKKIPKKNIKRSYIKIDKSVAPFNIFNIGNNKPVKLKYLVSLIENELKIKAKKNYRPMQPGDVKSTYADIKSLTNLCGFKPKTNIKAGLKKFINWYKNYHKII